MRPLMLLFAALWIPAVHAHEHAAHEHGVARLTLVQEGTRVSVEVDSPLINAVGFEHPPHTDAEREALGVMGRRLQSVDAVVRLPAAAACRTVAVDVDLPFGAHDDGHEHADEHDHDHEADDHGHEAHEHADVSAAYTLECGKPEALATVGVTLFDSFPHLQRVRAEVATDQGQGAATLTREAAQWRLPSRP